MSEKDRNMNAHGDEIDILDLFRKMGNGLGMMFRAIGRGILISIVFLFRKWLPLGLSIIAGVILSFALRYTTDSFYTSDLVLRTNVMSTSDMISYMNRLHIYSVEMNKDALKDALELKQSQINNILDISAYWIIDRNNDGTPDFVDYKNNHNVYDTLNVRMADRFDLRVKIKVPQELTIVKDGLIKYVESDSLFQQRNRLRFRQNQDFLTRLNFDISQLDSLQKIKLNVEAKNFYPRTGGQMVFLQEQKTQLVYPDVYNLFKQKQSLESEQEIFRGIVTILSEFSLPAKRDNGILYYSRIIIPIFLLVTVLLLIILENWKRLEAIYKKY